MVHLNIYKKLLKSLFDLDSPGDKLLGWWQFRHNLQYKNRWDIAGLTRVIKIDN